MALPRPAVSERQVVAVAMTVVITTAVASLLTVVWRTRPYPPGIAYQKGAAYG